MDSLNQKLLKSPWHSRFKTGHLKLHCIMMLFTMETGDKVPRSKALFLRLWLEVVLITWQSLVCFALLDLCCLLLDFRSALAQTMLSTCQSLTLLLDIRYQPKKRSTSCWETLPQAQVTSQYLFEQGVFGYSKSNRQFCKHALSVMFAACRVIRKSN